MVFLAVEPIIKGVLLFFPVLAAGLGSWLLLRAVQGYVLQRRLTRDGIVCPGQLLDYTEERRRKRVRYFARVRWTLPNGEPHTFQVTVSQDTPDPAPGTAVEVLVVPEAPETAVINAFWHRWFWPLGNLTLAAILLFMAGWLFAGLNAVWGWW